MAFFNHMPEFSTSSNVDQIHNLLNHDIDENLTDNINCKYYTDNEMCNLNEPQKAFNIFHANVNGLEPDSKKCAIRRLNRRRMKQSAES